VRFHDYASGKIIVSRMIHFSKRARRIDTRAAHLVSENSKAARVSLRSIPIDSSFLSAIKLRDSSSLRRAGALKKSRHRGRQLRYCLPHAFASLFRLANPLCGEGYPRTTG